jgi:hypothetical protein
LIETAFKRHEAVEINYGRRDGQIEEEDGEKPINSLGRAQLGGGADPRCADNENNLGENEVAQAQLFFENGGLRFNALFSARAQRIRIQDLERDGQGWIAPGLDLRAEIVDRL